jgi:signal transduction histidine kinase/CheY-like chemotaxis protein
MADEAGGEFEDVWFRTLFESVPDAILILGHDGRIRLANSAAEHLFGRPRAVLRSQRAESLLDHGERGRGAFDAGRMHVVLGLDGNDDPAPMEIRSASMTSPGGHVFTVVCIRDARSRRDIEIALDRSARLKSEFLANMSHELRTPLNAIIGFTELMHSGKVGPVSPEHQEFLGDVLTSSRHLLRLINDILDLAKVETGRIDLRPEEIDLPELVDDVRDILRGIAAHKRVRMHIEIASEPKVVFLDPARVKQVLYAFLSNAVKFTPDEGAIRIRVGPAGEDAWRLEVEDNGIGIAERDLHRIYGEFQTLRAPSPEAGESTGLGLALAKRVVEAHGGTVDVRSVLGKGSTFGATLPRILGAPVEAPPKRPAPPRHLRESSPTPFPLPQPQADAPLVLVVEDEAHDRDWLVQAMVKAGYLVDAASTGAEAIEKARNRPYAAVTLDMLLPDMSGWDVLREIRDTTLNHNVPVIVVTVSAAQGRTTGFRVQDYLLKPLSEETLLASLTKLAGAPSEGQTVLVVDEDRAALDLAGAALRQVGYRPILAMSSDEAVRAVEEEHPAAILLDPIMDGFQFVARLRRLAGGEDIPIILWTMKDLGAAEQARLRATADLIAEKTDLNGLTELRPSPRGSRPGK